MGVELSNHIGRPTGWAPAGETAPPVNMHALTPLRQCQVDRDIAARPLESNR